MRKLDFKTLSAALIATSLATTNVTPVLSYDVSPSSFFTQLAEKAAAGETAGAMHLVRGLQKMGVKFILAGGKRITLEQLAEALSKNTVGSYMLIRDLARAATSGDVAFGVGNRIITASAADQLDNFPLSSAG
jgi:hypothetical protein